MPKVLISDKLSESAVDIFKKNRIETLYSPGLSHDDLLKEIGGFGSSNSSSPSPVTSPDTQAHACRHEKPHGKSDKSVVIPEQFSSVVTTQAADHSSGPSKQNSSVYDGDHLPHKAASESPSGTLDIVGSGTETNADPFGTMTSNTPVDHIGAAFARAIFIKKSNVSLFGYKISIL